MKQLTALGLNSNKFEGPLPNIAAFPILQRAYLDQNNFRGPIYENITTLNKLKVLSISNNELSGPLPTSLGDLSNLWKFNVNGNRLTGKIPDSIENLKYVETFSVQLNNFIGTLPLGISQMSELKHLDVSNNELYGHVSSAYFTNMKSLQEVYLTNNSFSGPLPSMENNLNLATFDASVNKFSGEIPSSLLTLPSLYLFGSTVNCLSTHLPTSICSSSSLQKLYISGLGRAPSCSSFLDLYSYSSLPSCIWKITTLVELYVSGNGYFGSLDGFNLPKINKLNIASNFFHGYFPEDALNNKTMALLDSSSNVLTGTFNFDIYPAGSYGSNTLFANINRLSGPLNTVAIDRFKSPNVLDGGIYSCSTLPGNDVNFNYYWCGSSRLKVSLYIFLGIFIIYVVVILTFNPTVREGDDNSVRMSASAMLWDAIIKKSQTKRNFDAKKDMHEVNADTDLYSRTLHMDQSLRKFQIANTIYVAITTLLTAIVYAIFKYADSSHISILYNTHTYHICIRYRVYI